MTGNWMQAASLIANVALVVIGGLLSAWVKQTLGRVNDRIEKIERKQEQDNEFTWREIERAKQNIREVSEKSVSREDFIREGARNRQTMERLVEHVAELRGKLDVGNQLGAAVNSALATVLQREHEQGSR